MLNIATAPVNWNNDDLADPNPVPFPNILDLAHQAGYRAIEYNPAFGDDGEALLGEAERREMTWCGTYHAADLVSGSLTSNQEHDAEALASLLDSIHCHDMIVAADATPERIAIAGQVPADGSASLPAHAYPVMAANLHAIAAAAQQRGVRVHFHNHVGTWIETPTELNTLMEHLDSDLVDLCFDTGHYAYGGGNALAFLREHIGRIGYIHLKDVDGGVLAKARERGWSFLVALRHVVFSPLGEGSADIPAILETLVSSDFEGWVVVEQDTCEGDPTETAHANREFIERQVGGSD